MPLEVPVDLSARLHTLAQSTGQDVDTLVRRSIEAQLALQAPQPDPIAVQAAWGGGRCSSTPR